MNASLERHESKRPFWKRGLDHLATLALISMAGVVIWSNLRARNIDTTTVVETGEVLSAGRIAIGDDIKGDPGAPVGLVVFSDFECSYCGSFARNVLPLLEKQYVSTGRVAIGFRQFPSEATQGNSMYAAEIAVCAGKQGRFWQVHDRFFDRSVRINRRSIDDSVKELQLDLRALDECRKTDALVRIDQDLSDAIALNFRGTPAFVVGPMGRDRRISATGRIAGARSHETFKIAIDAALEKARVQ